MRFACTPWESKQRVFVSAYLREQIGATPLATQEGVIRRKSRPSYGIEPRRRCESQKKDGRDWRGYAALWCALGRCLACTRQTYFRGRTVIGGHPGGVL